MAYLAKFDPILNDWRTNTSTTMNDQQIIDLLQHLIDRVKFERNPQFTKPFKLQHGGGVDTFRSESPLGSEHSAVIIRTMFGGTEFNLRLNRDEASALMCCLLAQLNKLEEFDAKRNAVTTEDDAN